MKHFFSSRQFSGAPRGALAALLAAAFMISALSGCASSPYPDLPDQPVAFRMGSFVDENDDGATYGTIEYEGRTYIPYGTIRRSVTGKDIEQCVGYIVMSADVTSVPDPDDTDTRVYTLADNPEHNYLMDYYTGKSIMEQPSFWRAIDTHGQDIYTPDYIESLEYGYWE